MYQDPNQQYGAPHGYEGYPQQGGYPQGFDGGYPQHGGYPAGPSDPYAMQQYPPDQDPYAAEQALYHEQMMQANAEEQKKIQEKIDKLERKQLEKKKRDKQKAKDHEQGTERKLARDHEDNQSCANLLCVWGMINALMWTGPLMGDAWYTKVMHGMGVEKLQMTTGLFNMDTQVTCSVGYLVGDNICRSVDPYSGHFAIQQMMELMCKEVVDGCALMEQMFYVSHVPLVCLPASAAFETISVLLLYCYWHGIASGFIKSTALKFAVLAPFTGMLGFFIWLGFSPNMGVLPRMWCAAHGNGDFANSTLFGLKEVPWTIPFGWCSLMLLFVVLGSSIRAFCNFSMLGEHRAEREAYQKAIDADIKEESKELVQKELEEARYGATN